jgi:hypothetical protein
MLVMIQGDERLVFKDKNRLGCLSVHRGLPSWTIRDNPWLKIRSSFSAINFIIYAGELVKKIIAENRLSLVRIGDIHPGKDCSSAIGDVDPLDGSFPSCGYFIRRHLKQTGTRVVPCLIEARERYSLIVAFNTVVSSQVKKVMRHGSASSWVQRGWNQVVAALFRLR